MLNNFFSIRSTALSMLSYNNLKTFFESIKDLQYVIIKGEPLSYHTYKSFGKRQSSDIDILISKKNIVIFKKMLVENGFNTGESNRSDEILFKSFSHQIAPYFKKLEFGNIDIDINFDIFWGEYTGKRINIDDFISDIIEMNIYGCKIKTLSPLKTMIQLILHHYKDMNSIFLLATRKSINYNMFKDVYYLLKNNLNDININNLYNISAEFEIIHYVYYIFYYTGLIFEDDILKKYIKKFQTREGQLLLNYYGLTAAERREWKVDFKIRIESDNLYEIIKNDLTEKDLEKIAINKKVFLGE